MSRRVLVYVAGPYTAPTPEGVQANVDRALDAYNEVLDLGCNAFLPHMAHFAHQRRERDYETWMEVDFAALERCDVLYRMQGVSSGADREVERAFQIGIPVAFSLADLPKIVHTLEALGWPQLVARRVPRRAPHDPETCEVCVEKRDLASRKAG